MPDVLGKIRNAALNGKVADASDIEVKSSGFDGNLATTDDTVQKVAQKLDDLTVSGGGSGLESGEIGTFAFLAGGGDSPGNMQWTRKSATVLRLGITDYNLLYRLDATLDNHGHIWIGSTRVTVTSSRRLTNVAEVTVSGYTVPTSGALKLFWDENPPLAEDVAVKTGGFDGTLARASTNDAIDTVQKLADAIDLRSAMQVGTFERRNTPQGSPNYPGEAQYTQEAGDIYLGIQEDEALRKRLTGVSHLWIDSTRHAVTVTDVVRAGESVVRVVFGTAATISASDITVFFDPTPTASSGAPGGLQPGDVEAFAKTADASTIPARRFGSGSITRDKLRWDASRAAQGEVIRGTLIGQYSEAGDASNIADGEYHRASDTQLILRDTAHDYELDATVWVDFVGYDVSVTPSVTAEDQYELALTSQESWPDFGSLTISVHRAATNAAREDIGHDVIHLRTAKTFSVEESLEKANKLIVFAGTTDQTFTLPYLGNAAAMEFSLIAICHRLAHMTLNAQDSDGNTDATISLADGDTAMAEWRGSTWVLTKTALSAAFTTAVIQGKQIQFRRLNTVAGFDQQVTVPIPDPATSAEATGLSNATDFITPATLGEVLSSHHIETGNRMYFGALGADPASRSDLDSLQTSPIPRTGPQTVEVDRTWSGGQYMYLVQVAGTIDISSFALDGQADSGWTRGTFSDSDIDYEYWKSPYTWTSSSSQGVDITVERVIPTPDPDPVYAPTTLKTQADTKFSVMVGPHQGDALSIAAFSRQSSTRLRIRTTDITVGQGIAVGDQLWLTFNGGVTFRTLVLGHQSVSVSGDVDLTLDGSVSIPDPLTTLAIHENVAEAETVLKPSGAGVEDYIAWGDADELKVTLDASDDFAHTGRLQYSTGGGNWYYVRKPGTRDIMTVTDVALTHTFTRETFEAGNKLRLRVQNHLPDADAPDAVGRVFVTVEHLVGRRRPLKRMTPVTSAMNLTRVDRSTIVAGFTPSWNTINFTEAIEIERIKEIALYPHRRTGGQTTERHTISIGQSEIALLGINPTVPAGDNDAWNVIVAWGNEDELPLPVPMTSLGFVRQYTAAGMCIVVALKGSGGYLTGLDVIQPYGGSGDADQVRLETDAVQVIYR